MANRHWHKPAFSLVELLVVLAVVSLLIALLLPSLVGARRAARKGISAANLRGLAAVQSQYGTDSKDSFVNPFDPRTGAMYAGQMTPSGPPCFDTVVLPQSTQQSASGPFLAMNLDDSTRSTEAFVHIWGSFIANYLYGVDGGLACLRDPADPVLANKAAAMRDSTLPAEQRLFDTSYWYPPVFWLRFDRYLSESSQPITTSAVDSRWLARNRFTDPPSPSLKVLLFERFDWSVQRRSAGGGTTAAGPPQWNNPGAKPQCAFVDGSASVVRMTDVHARGESAMSNQISVFRPSGVFDPDPPYTVYWLLGPLATDASTTDPFETGSAPFVGTSAWRQYFYATRRGVRGMDVPTR